MSNNEATTRSLPSAPILPLTYEPHPLAGLMPMMDEEPFKMFKANIAKEGIKQPIIIYQGLGRPRANFISRAHGLVRGLIKCHRISRREPSLCPALFACKLVVGL
jgi:hypothetical protein